MTSSLFIYVPRIQNKLAFTGLEAILKNLQKAFCFHHVTMAFTNGTILSDLREKKSTPGTTNLQYENDVQDWYWTHLGEHGIWKNNCNCFENWVKEKAFAFQKYAKDIWEKSGRSYRNIQQKNKEWLAKPIEFPDMECSCMEVDHDENQQVCKCF